METEQFKFIVGAVDTSKPAYMRFYGRVCEESTQKFNDEFLWLQDYIKPSKIVISINSEGGSVLHGMTTYSIIQNSPIETETIIEGIAASMGSVLWAAGTRSYMRDYSILMIHNPFYNAGNQSPCEKTSANNGNNQMVEAFRKQIETIYTKRFGLSKDTVKKIMDGDEGCDGTYFDAEQAVKAGILPSENILKTSKQVRSKVKNQIEGLVEASKIQEMMTSINSELDKEKLFKDIVSIPKKINKISNFKNNMEEETEVMLGSICSTLGIQTNAEVSEVVSKIQALQNTVKQLADMKNEFDSLRIQKEGLDAQLSNVKDELDSVKSELKVYKDAEEAQKTAEISDFIDSAIKDNKIKEESKEMWVEMAKTNFEMVKNTLNSIEKQEKLSSKIAEDPANIHNAQDGLNEAERRMKEAVTAIVGEDFKFNTFD